LIAVAALIIGWLAPVAAQKAPGPDLYYNAVPQNTSPTDTDIIMTRIQVAITAPSTYFETMGWNLGLNGAGYCGLQDSGPLGRNYILALWDPTSGGGESTAVYSDPSGNVVRSCAEGCGITYKNYNMPWQANQWYRLVARAWDYQGQTYFALWSYDETGDLWTHHATFAFPFSGTRFDAGGGAILSFLEDWTTNGQYVRRDNLNDGWGRSPSAGWIPYSNAQFLLATVTGQYANAYDAGVQNGAYYMQSGGNTTPTLSVGTDLTLPFTKTSPGLPVGRVLSATASYNRAANQISVSWVTDPTVSPQFTYQVNVYNNPGLTGTPIASYSDTNPDVRSVVLAPPARGTSVYYASVSITDIFDQAVVPASVPVFNTGTAAYIWPGTLLFTPLPVGATASSQTVTLTNIRASSLAVSTVAIGGANAGDFAKKADSCTGAMLTPNGTCTVSVTFTPSATGSRSASLTFTDNGNGVSGSTQTVSLVGAGDDPVPFINEPLVPTSAAPGGPAFTLTVSGTGFTSGATVGWNGEALATTFVSSEELKAAVPAANIALPGTAWVTVVNPGSALVSNTASFPVRPSGPTVSFVSANGSPVAAGNGPVAIAVGDFDGDGKMDLAVANVNDADLTILLGNGDGTFTAAPSPATGIWPSGVAVGDFNGDGKLDLAVVNQDTDNVTILLGNGDGTFTAAPVSPYVGSGPLSLAVGDFNGDGKLDLAVANWAGNSVSILLGNGDGTFISAFQTLATGSEPFLGSIAVGDFNGDGNLDLAVTNSGSNNVTILLGNGDGTFTPAASSPATGSFPDGIAVGDFNGDGKLDLAVTNSHSDTLTILLGNGDGTFTPAPVSPATGGSPCSVVVGDLNGDGKLDLAVVNFDSTVTILLGNGDGTFTPAPPYQYTGGGPKALAIGDFNGDGALDLATANFMANNVSVLLQVLPAPVAELSPSSLTFGNQPVGTTSPSSAVTVTNKGTASLSFTSIAASGDFAIAASGTTCSTSAPVAAGSNCVIDLTFTPTAIGARSASLTLTDNSNGVAGGTQTVALSGTGLAPATLTPASSNFRNVAINTPSRTQTFTLTNNLLTPLNISSIGFTGPNYADFSQTNTCGTLPTSLAGGTSCTLSVTFTPSVLGAESATLTINDNAPAPSNTLTSPLSGTGVADATLTPASCNFRNVAINTPSKTQTFTLKNNELTALNISSMGFKGANSADFSQTNTCGTLPTSLAGGASCTLSVAFTPSVLGAESATLTINDNAPAPYNTFTSPLCGTGVADATLGPSAYSFHNVAIKTPSNPETFTLRNSQLTALNISSIGFTGTNAGDFSQTNTCGTPPTSLAGGASCTLSVTFTPSALGAESATLTINDNAPTPYNALTSALSGTGMADATLAPSASNFRNVAIKTPSKAQTFTLKNNESTALNISSMGFTGANSADFSQTNTCGTLPTSLAGGASCTLSVTFTPSVLGSESATLTVNDSAAAAQYQTLTSGLSGTGLADATLTPASSNFRNVAINTPSKAQTFTLGNNELTALNISSIGFTGTNSGDFSQTDTCGTVPASLAAGASCTISVTFTPSVAGAETATLTVSDNAAAAQYQTLTSGLSGTGLADATLTPTSASFGSVVDGTPSKVENFTLHNGELTALNISSIGFTGTNYGDFSQTDTCGTLPASLAAGASCTISVMFTPSVAGAETATLTVNDNAAAAQYRTLTSGLSGTGLADATLTPASTNFGNVAVDTASNVKTFTLKNNQSATLNISSIGFTGTNYGDFSQTNTCGTLPTSLAAGASCTVSVTFTPSVAGAETATLTVSDNAAAAQYRTLTSGLSGTGLADATLIPASTSFGNVAVDTASNVRIFTLKNNQSGTLSISSIEFTGTNYGDFSQTNTCGTLPTSLAAGASCTISVTFTPSTTGPEKASLTVNDSAAAAQYQTLASAVTGTGK
jgi:hypothetical protein